VIAGAFSGGVLSLQDTLAALASQAVLNAGGGSDNTSVAALRFLE
jgi:hypothetical protein